MRERKYRAWCKARKQMGYTNEEYWFVFNSCENNCVAFGLAMNCEDMSIMEWIGRKDDAQQDIYESDILEFSLAKERIKGLVVWDESAASFFIQEERTKDYIPIDEIVSCIVIGNSFENWPEIKHNKIMRWIAERREWGENNLNWEDAHAEKALLNALESFIFPNAKDG